MPKEYIALILGCAVFCLLAIVILFMLHHRKKLKDTPSIIHSMYMLAIGKEEAALEELITFAKAGNIQQEAYTVIATLCRRKGEYLKAIHIGESMMLRRKIQRSTMLIVLQELIKCYAAINSFDKAEDWLIAIKDIKDNAFIKVRADLFAGKGLHGEAIRQYLKYEKVADVKCDKEIAREYIAIASQSPDISSKIKALKHAVKRDADNKNCYIGLANAYISENKSQNALKEMENVLQRGLVCTAKEIKSVKDFYFSQGKMNAFYEIMSAKITEGTNDPYVYISMAEYYQKTVNNARAESLLKNYLSNKNSKVILQRFYAELTNDPVLAKIINNEAYVCPICGTKYTDYVDTCTKCFSIGTLQYN